jgi:hypothetical protein
MAMRRCGESGRASEARGFLPCGLGARAPGPTEELNFEMPDVGGVRLTELLLWSFSPLELGVGVLGDELEGLRRALATGTKMPAPAVLVVK